MSMNGRENQSNGYYRQKVYKADCVGVSYSDMVSLFSALSQVSAHIMLLNPKQPAHADM